VTLPDLFRIDDYSVVVTGAGQGIGRGIAVGLAQAGADVVIVARRQGDLDETARQVEAAGRRAITISADVREPGINDRIAHAAVEAYGRLDVWVNNVGGSDDNATYTLLDTSADYWRSMLELNLTSAFLGAQAAARQMGTRGGSIVNIASGAGMRGSPLTGAYAAAKAGMINLTQTLALELAPHIRVNAVSPGQVPTEAFEKVLGMGPDQLRALAEATPLQRLGTPQDIAAAVLFFVSPAGSWVTGENLLVAGGRRERGGTRQRYG
jgi:7-alpha-hydroxysteroid dehydrogenase